MDLWVVAAAAGAGYIAKNFQSSSVLDHNKNESSVEQSYKYCFSGIQSESRNFLQQFRDKTCPLRKLGQKNRAFLDVENDSELNFPENDRLNNEDLESGVASTSGNALVKDRSYVDYDAENRGLSKLERGRVVRSRRLMLDSIRPLHSSTGSCIENMEDGLCLYPAVRPVLVTDGNRIISKSSSCSSLMQAESCKEEARLSHSREPDTKTVLLFITGMSIGIMSATTTWKNEVDILNKQLRRLENLVQDLHEELDMKDTMMVEELTEPISSPSGVKMTNLTKLDSPDAHDKIAENAELMSRIEAELQAELEMLELNISESAIDRISDVVELDPDFEPEVIKGDLKPTIANGIYGDSSESGPTNYSTPTNYPICPWELSLRLHELIESRLERRITELEIALNNSQNSQNVISRRQLSYSETESSSAHQSPTCIYDEQEMEYEHIMNNSVVMEEGGLLDSVQDFLESPYKKMSRNFMLDDDCQSEDEGCGDESEMLLIKQILERRKSGSGFKLKNLVQNSDGEIIVEYR